MWLLIPILIYSLIFLYIRHVYSHWRRRGFPSERVNCGWRFLKQVYKREFQHVVAVNEAYCAGREKLYGIYFFFRPTLLVRDVGVARTILENSYVHFSDSKWDHVKAYRKINLLEKLAPIFAASRVEGMFRNVEKIADNMVKHLRARMLEHGSAEADLQYVLRVYSINIIGNLIYGLDGNNFEQPCSVFSNYINYSLSTRNLSSFTLNHLPKKSSLTYRLRDIIKDNVESREDGGFIRKDILQLLVKFRNGNHIGNGSKQSWHVERVFEREKVLSIKKLSKIAERFLNMGFETMASTVLFTLYELLQDPTVRNKVLEEIKRMKEAAANNATDNNKQLTYADFEQLKYLDACIKETLRKYPGVPIIERVCRKNFNIPDSRYTISAGKTVMIPLMALQADERHFEEPLKYKPERFLQVDGVKRKGCAFIGYGLGAGVCVAQNFTNIVIKLALVKLLSNFNMALHDTKHHLIVHNPAPLIKSREGFKVKLTNREIK